MVPNQKDVLTDYLNDMFGVSKSNASSKSETENESVIVSSVNNDQINDDVKHADCGENSSSILSESIKGAGVEQMDSLIVDSFGSKDRSSGSLKAHASMEAPAILKDKEAPIMPELATGLSELSFQINPDKQLACLIDLVNRPIEQLTEGEKSIVLMDLLGLLKGLPESRLKSMFMDRFEAVNSVELIGVDEVG